jgi:hypothetical protein
MTANSVIYESFVVLFVFFCVLLILYCILPVVLFVLSANTLTKSKHNRFALSKARLVVLLVSLTGLGSVSEHQSAPNPSFRTVSARML